MTQSDFNSAFQAMSSQQLGSAPHEPRYITDQILRRDRSRTRVLAFLSLLFWLIGTAGMLLLVIGLNRFVLMIRVGEFGATTGRAPIAPLEDQILWGTSLIHHSIPFIEASIVSMMLAAMFTVMLIFSSRQATLNRITVSLMEMSNQLKRGPELQEGHSPSLQTPPNAALILIMALLALLACGGAIATAVWLSAERPVPTRAWQGYPILSPFQAVRWQGETPWVQIDGNWYQLDEIDGVPVKRITDFSKSLGPSMWQKHFEEDLVELMTKIGNPPGRSVTLRVQRAGTTTIETLKDVPMTEANRWALWQARQNATSQPTSHP